MARPYRETFEQDLQSPMTPMSAGGANTPISYKTNVNRQKTTKWTNAKPVSYDDWDDDDDYGDDPTPPPIQQSKPTGLRQPGQAAQVQNQLDAPVLANKKTYGDLPSTPQGNISSRARANSFDVDEERNFSSGAMQPSATATAPAPATRFSQITGIPSTRGASGPPALSISTQQPSPQPVTGLRKTTAPATISDSTRSPHPDSATPRPTESSQSSTIISPVSVSDARAPSIDYQTRQDYSPSAEPPPLHTRGVSATYAGAPASAASVPATRFPGRKSSLSQPTGPSPADLDNLSHEITPKPWTSSQSSAMGVAPPSPATQEKALPFVRPADIYKRRLEEEKKRLSADSSEPNIDPATRSNIGDRSDPPPPAQQLDGTSSGDSSGNSLKTSVYDTDNTRPALEPVKEGSSENVHEPPSVGGASLPHNSQQTFNPLPSQQDRTELEERRTHSTSPVLPNVNRISSFGMNIFPPPQPEVSKTLDDAPVLTPASSQKLETVQESTLKSQPSLGFRSAVNQAFDRKSDASLPATPTSRTNSEMRRTDSESTGTTGISPIMSRAPSSAVTEARTQQTVAPSIPEAVEEMTGPQKDVQVDQQPEPAAMTFKPGHRRDISMPSRDNSPARKPELAKSVVMPSGDQVVVSEPTPVSTGSTLDLEPLHPPRPLTQREESFRPVLPGGWTSYATTARSESPNKGLSAETPRNSSPVPSQSELQDPQKSLTTNQGYAPLHTERRDLSPPHETGGHFHADPSLPTPDLAMAPSGSLYSTNPLDPRLLPKDGTNFEAPAIKRPDSTGSSQGPTPLPKDTPVITDDSSGYFPKPTVPLKQKTVDEIAVESSLEPPHRPQVLPTLSTDTRTHDEESDRLRKEIVKSLGHNSSNTLTRDDSLLSVSESVDDPSNPARISSYLPSEYENYWASTNEEDVRAPVVTAPASDAIQTNIHPQVKAPVIAEPESYLDPELSPQPLATRKNETMFDTPTKSRPSVGPHQYSWDPSSESVLIAPESQQSSALADVKQPDQTAQASPTLDTRDATTSVVEETSPTSQIHPSDDMTRAEDHDGRDAAVIAGAATVLGATAIGYNAANKPAAASERRLSLAEEKDPRVSSYPVSPTPPEDEHPSRRSSQPLFTPSSERPATTTSPPPLHSPAPAPNSISPMNSTVQPQPTQLGVILPFKEIAAIKTSELRTQKYNETRHKFAAMESGLTNWIAQLQSQYPEHADVTGSFGRPTFGGPSSATRSKFSPSGLSPASQQQPYYQQYLNASSPTTPGTPVSRPGPNVPVGSQQGFSPAAGLTTQQVQAKGKELLHTAGVFGGKAGKVGKGLLAKGKNRLRGTGGDKTSTSPPAKPKNDRRTSWGMPMTLSRSSGTPDDRSRNSREISRQTTPNPTQNRQRAATLTLDTRNGNSKSPRRGDTVDSYGGDMMSAPGILDNLSNMSGALPIIESPVNDNHHENNTQHQQFSKQNPREQPRMVDIDYEGKLNVPAPIAKNQPSWDPFNATPIKEEENQFEDIAHHAPESKPVPGYVGDASASERSNSVDTYFYDAPEEPIDANEWVMVPKAQDAKMAATDLPAPNLPPTIPEISMHHTSLSPDHDENELREDTNQYDDELTPTAAKTSTNLYVNHQIESREPTSGRPRAASILDRPRYSYDVPRADQAPAAVSQSSTTKSEPHPPPAVTTPPEYKLPVAIGNPQYRRSQQEPLARPRYSYDVPRVTETSSRPPSQSKPPLGDYRPPPVNTSLPRQESSQEPQSATSFMGLPPIRRTSAFGVAFDSRHGRPRQSVSDETEITDSPSQASESGRRSAEIALAAGVVTAEGLAHREAHRQSINQDTTRPPMYHGGSRSYGIRPGSKSEEFFSAPRAAEHSAEGLRRSQDSWRPNSISQSPGAPTYTASPTRASYEQSQSRQSFSQRPSSNSTARNYDQPPSSAQRYPNLFRPEQPDFEAPHDGDLPAHYYQAPIAREEAFLPRQQTSEYQIPGVGPPPDEPLPASRRSSGIFREIGSKIRAASRERANSLSRSQHDRSNSFHQSNYDGSDSVHHLQHSRGQSLSQSQTDGQGTEYAESSIASEEGQEHKKRRSSFFGSLNRVSTTTMHPPQSRESMVAHMAGSRTNLMLTPGATPAQSPVVANDKLRSFFGEKPNEKSSQSKVGRAATTAAPSELGKKKGPKRFSNLSNMFSRSKEATLSANDDRPAISRGSSHPPERQAAKSPMPEQQPSSIQQMSPGPNSKPSSQQRSFLSKLTVAGGGDANHPKQDNKIRKSSTTGMLSGIMGRKSQQPEKRDDSSRSSQGGRSAGSQPKEKDIRPNQVPPARSYTDIAENTTPLVKAAPTAPWRDEPKPDKERDRGRRISRDTRMPPQPEPQYAAVPIPGGYQLVRGDGAQAVPTQYDPRGFNLASQTHQSPVIPQGPTQSQTRPGQMRYVDDKPASSPPLPQHPSDRRSSQQPLPVSDNSQSTRRISREDAVARSPARQPMGQQRPYQLSLPTDEDERNSHRSNSLDRERLLHSAPAPRLQTTATRLALQQPTLRHPESPAGYPLPEDNEAVFSPINPDASRMAPPPPPKWPRHLDNVDHHHLHVGNDLDRSNTHRTAVSGISVMSTGSTVTTDAAMLKPIENEGLRSGIAPSPSPPSPGITPPRKTSALRTPASQQGDIRTTVLARGVSPDLYDASPRLPKEKKEKEKVREQEEKIFYDQHGGEGAVELDTEPVMSATSFPGQEWNPYAGVYEEFD